MVTITNYSNMTLREWQMCNKSISDMIVQASCIDGSDSWQPFPIGMQYEFANHFRKSDNMITGNHNRTVLCAVNDTTDSNRRPNGINRKLILSNLNKNNIKNISVKPKRYYKNLPNYKFVISPEGNGIDCHRHYEALMSGCIPILEDNPLTKKKYKKYPVLFTKDYSEVNEDYLNAEYIKMMDKTYNFSKLFLSSYNKINIHKIKHCGNYWVKRMTNKNWY